MVKFKNINKSLTDRPSSLSPLAGPIVAKAPVKSKVPLARTAERVSEARPPLVRFRTSVLILSVAVILQLALLISMIYLSPFLNRYN